MVDRKRNEPIEMKHEVSKRVEVSFRKLSNERKEGRSFGVQVTYHCSKAKMEKSGIRFKQEEDRS